MYKAVRSFTKSESDMLSFKEGEEFNFIEEHDQHWWVVQNINGETGLVPAAYLQVNKVVKTEVLESIDRAISLIHKRAAECGGPIPVNDRKNLQKLISHRKMVMADQSLWSSGTNASVGSVTTSKVVIPSQPSRPAPQPPSRLVKGDSVKSRKAPEPPNPSKSHGTVPTKQSSPFDDDHRINIGKINLPDNFGSDVIEMLTYRFSLKPDVAQAVAICAYNQLGQAVSAIRPLMQEVEGILKDSSKTVAALTAEVEDEEQIKMRKILDELTKHKDNSQQRGWAIEEDFDVINNLIDSLTQMLASVKKKVAVKLLAEDDYGYLHNLVVFYQLESRRKLRTNMLQLFGSMCQLKEDIVSQLLCSILPTELAQDLMNEKEDIVHLLSTSLMLTMLFSTGEVVPYTHYAQFNKDFTRFLLHGIENSMEIDESHQIPDCYTALLLSFNQHFSDSKKNLVLSVLGEGDCVRTFSEKILILINREEDPVALFDFRKAFPDSVFKMFADIFSTKETSNMFFTNDLFVLYDIILRQVTNREAGDEVRTEYLSLLHSVLQMTNYAEHKYRVDELRRCLRRISTEEGPEVEADRFIVKEILTSFKAIF